MTAEDAEVCNWDGETEAVVEETAEFRGQLYFDASAQKACGRATQGRGM